MHDVSLVTANLIALIAESLLLGIGIVMGASAIYILFRKFKEERIATGRSVRRLRTMLAFALLIVTLLGAAIAVCDCL